MAAKGIELASAYVSLSVSTDKIPGQIKNALRGLDKDVSVDVDANTTGASADLSRWRKEEQANKVNVKVDVDTRGASTQLAKLRKDLDFGPGFLNLNVGAAALSTLPALAAGLGNVASALQQVAQAGLAVPGGIAAATASVGTLMFGLTGVADAYTALSDASSAAATSGAGQAAQARASQSASNGLRNAIVDEAQARKDVARATKDAQNALQDLRIEQRGGVIDEKRAVLEAQKAREDLARGNYTDIRDAILRVQESDQRLIETRERNRQTTEKLADANSKGVAGSDQVVAANERLVRSEQSVVEAQGAVAAAAPQASAAQQKAAAALAKLSPNAREFVQTMNDLANGPVGALRNLVQDNIFDGLSDQLRGVATKGAPTFEKGLGGISKAWNATFKTLGAELGSDKNLGLLDRIFGNTADAQTRLNGVIHPITEAVATLSAAGSDAMPKLADSLVGVANRFDAFITNADKDGRLDKWINEGIDALGNLGETALNVGKMFTAITNASGTSNLLGTISQLTDKWQAFLNSDAGQAKIKQFFAEGKQIFGQWKPLLEDLPAYFRGVYDAAKEWTDAFLPPLRMISGLLTDHPTLIRLVAESFLAWKTITTVSGLLESLNNVADVLGVGIPGAAKKGGAAVEGFATTALTRPNPVAALVGSIAYTIAFGDRDTNPQTQTSGGPGQPQLPGVNFNPTPPPANGNPMPGLFNPDSSSPMPGALSIPGGGGPGAQAQRRGAASATPAGQPAQAANAPTSGNEAVVYSAMIAAGYPASEWDAMRNLMMGESGFRNTAQNPSSTAYGMFQFLDDTWATVGGQKTSDPGMQAQYGLQYIKQRYGSPSAAWAFWQAQSPHWYDSGGHLPPGYTLAYNGTGKPELILTGDQAQSVMSAVDPNTTVHGTGGGALPGPDQLTQAALDLPQQQDDPSAAFRTEGFVPAGTTGVPGTSTLSSLLNLGNEAVGGVIDTGASIAKMAASAAITGGTFGAGAAAAPAAGFGIDTAANALKRTSSYGFQLLGIGADSLIENAFSMLGGAPRWLGYDYTQFAPKLDIKQAAVTTAEKAWAALHGGGNGVDPNTTVHGTAMGALPGPGDQAGLPAPPTDPFGTNSGAPSLGPSGPNSQQPDPNDPLSWLKSGVFDTGGVLHPNTAAINLSNQPEYVLTPQQWKAMEDNVRVGGEAAGGSGATYNVYAQDADDAMRRLRSKEKLDSMQYGGRPW